MACVVWVLGVLRPNRSGLPECRVIGPKLSEGLKMAMEDLAVDKMVKSGVWRVPPEKAHELFEGFHSHLEAAGIDGVKVDVIHVSTALLSSTHPSEHVFCILPRVV